jgi:O-antigen ligase/tetratricopeptide (TPR) repeat protein
MKDFLQTIIVGGVFALPFIVLIVVNDLFFPFITGKNFAFRIIIEIIFGAWVVLALLDARFRPRWSWIVGGFGALLAVLLISNTLGAHPPTSFWSNFERMEGYVTLVHLFMYVLVAGSVLRTTQLWGWFWHISLLAASYVALDGLQEYAENSSRIQGVLGNAAYLAIYMLFHVFVALYLFVRNTNIAARVGYALLAVLFAYVLLQTGTRGTAIGMVAGLGTVVAYLAVFGRQYPQVRMYAVGLCALLVVLLGGFFAARESAFVQNNSTLARIANIDLQEDLEVRGVIWGMALEGVAERPVFGWGQSNFNFVFNQNYDPFLYDQEQWFDRVHNIFLDWLIAGGVLGFAAYFVMFGAALYYLMRGQRVLPQEEQFTVLEQAVLVGALAGYLTHNLVVFDNIISYIFFASILAMIHARIGSPIAAVQSFAIRRDTVLHVVAPATLVVLGAVVYFVNIPSYHTAAGIIDAMRAPTIEEKLNEYNAILENRGFGKQEVAEQMAQEALRVWRQQDVDPVKKERFAARAEEVLVEQIQEKPGDARLHVFLGAFYRTIEQPQAAQDEFAVARDLSPNKPSIVVQQGATELALGNATSARDFFKEALNLDERNQQARVLYAASLFSLGENATAKSVLEAGGEAAKRAFATDNFALNTVKEADDRSFLIELYELRSEVRSDDPQTWASLAFLYYEAGQNDAAIETLNAASDAIPDFADTASCYIDNIRAGEEPAAGCEQ